MITAALGTLPFIATLGLLVVLGRVILAESGGKIVAALKLESFQEASTTTAGRPLRSRSPGQLAIRRTEHLRAAA